MVPGNGLPLRGHKKWIPTNPEASITSGEQCEASTLLSVPIVE
jgi:hypothetical protein